MLANLESRHRLETELLRSCMQTFMSSCKIADSVYS